MNIWQVTIIAGCLLLTAAFASAESLCGSAGRGCPSDSDGSQWLTYTSSGNETLELILREEDGVIIARGITPNSASSGAPREVYSLFDLATGTVVHAVSKLNAMASNWKSNFNRDYSMQNHFDIKLYSSVDTFSGELKSLLTLNAEKNCHDELKKRNQGRTYDKEKCGEVHQGLNTVMATLVNAEGSGFKEISKNAQVAKYIANYRERRGSDYCTGIEKMTKSILKDYKDPDTQKKLTVRKKMPGYLDPDQGGFEKEIRTYEQYR